MKDDIKLNINSKNKLARLLAAENIAVEHQNIKTPAFDVKNRVLILPIWKDVDEPLLDRLIGHESSHAVFTPQKEFLDLFDKSKLDKDTQILKEFVNVVEDVRIEKLIIKKFPGLLPNFIKSCQTLMSKDYFGVKGKDINTLNPADRINLYFKVNVYDRLMDIKFSPQEEYFLDKMSKITTWQETIDIAKELMEFCKKQAPQMFDSMNGGEGEEDDEDTFIEVIDANGDVQKINGKNIKVIITQKNWDNNIQNKNGKSLSQHVSTAKHHGLQYDTENENIFISAGSSEYDPAGFIIPVKTTFDSFSPKWLVPPDTWRQFTSTVPTYLSTMIQEFQRKKRASVWLTRQRNITGILDTNSMHKYRYSDEIFKTETIFKKGKNHTVTMFLDFSGSMDSILPEVIKQTYLMVLFCRQIGIKHVVYAFSDDQSSRAPNGVHTLNRDRNEMALNYSFKLVELFNHTMKKIDFEQMASNLYRCTSHRMQPPVKNPHLYTNGTPLNDTLLLSQKLLRQIKEAHKSDVLSCIFLTDGYSNASRFFNKWTNDHHANIYPDRNKRYYLNSAETGKSHDMGNNHFDVTHSLVNLIRGDLGINMINFHIVPNCSGVLPTYLSNISSMTQYAQAFNQTGKCIVTQKDSKSWDAVILSATNLLAIKPGDTTRETKHILKLVIDLLS